jgi:hypothetical protein
LEGHTSGLVFWFGGPYLWRDSTTNSVYYLLEAAEDRTARGVEEFDQRCMRLGQAARRHLDCHGFGHYSVRIVVVPDTLFGARWLTRLMPLGALGVFMVCNPSGRDLTQIQTLKFSLIVY